MNTYATPADRVSAAPQSGPATEGSGRKTAARAIALGRPALFSRRRAGAGIAAAPLAREKPVAAAGTAKDQSANAPAMPATARTSDEHSPLAAAAAAARRRLAGSATVDTVDDAKPKQHWNTVRKSRTSMRRTRRKRALPCRSRRSRGAAVTGEKTRTLLPASVGRLPFPRCGRRPVPLRPHLSMGLPFSVRSNAPPHRARASTGQGRCGRGYGQRASKGPRGLSVQGQWRAQTPVRPAVRPRSGVRSVRSVVNAC